MKQHWYIKMNLNYLKLKVNIIIIYRDMFIISKWWGEGNQNILNTQGPRS